MPPDPYESEIMRQCQRGIRFHVGGTGSFCRKRDLCRAEGRCHFVAQAERHRERVWATRPNHIVWSRAFDQEPEPALFSPEWWGDVA